MTSLRLHLSDVSRNHYKVNCVSNESIRTPGAVVVGFQTLYLHFLPCILYYLVSLTVLKVSFGGHRQHTFPMLTLILSYLIIDMNVDAFRSYDVHIWYLADADSEQVGHFLY